MLSCPVMWLCNPTDCSLPGSSVHGHSPGKNTEVGYHFLLQGSWPESSLNHWESIYCKTNGLLTSSRAVFIQVCFQKTCRKQEYLSFFFFFFSFVIVYYQSRLFCSTLAGEIRVAYYSWISDNFTYSIAPNLPLQAILKWIPQFPHKLDYLLNWWCR